MTTRVEIDPNVRVRGNQTFTGLEDVYGPIAVGDEVEVFEAEADIVGTGRIAEISVEKRLVYLSVEWGSLRDRQDFPLPKEESDALWTDMHTAPRLMVATGARGFGVASCIVSHPAWAPKVDSNERPRSLLEVRS